MKRYYVKAIFGDWREVSAEQFETFKATWYRGATAIPAAEKDAYFAANHGKIVEDPEGLTPLTTVANLKKGDIITLHKVTTYWDSENETDAEELCEHKFEIVRNNPKSYGCKYISGAYTGMGFGWPKGSDLTQHMPRLTYYKTN